MSIFTGSSVFVTGGTFTSTNITLPTHDFAGVTQALGETINDQVDDLQKRSRGRSLDGLMIVKADEVDLHRELIRGISYRIHSASHHGRFVAVKAFEGPSAKQNWTVDVAFSKEFLHPNVLKIVGVSDEGSKSHFVLFHGITSEQRMQSLIAKALRTDLNMSVRISMKAVKGLAAGLSYINSRNIPIYPETINNNWKWENFDIFTGYDDEPVISFDTSSTDYENGSVSQTLDNEIDGRGVGVLSGLCQQLFSGANSILYDDSPEREFDVYDGEDFLRATLEDTERTPNVFESEDIPDPSNSTEKPKSCRTPRREVWWLDLGAKNQSLESIKRRFEDFLNHFLSSSSNSLLRHFTSPMDNKLRKNLHQCPGYLREEITLTSDVSKSIIISHAFPSESEVCSVCGQLVQYKCAEPSIVDGENQESSSSNGSHHLPRLQPSGIPSPHSPIVGPSSPVLSDMSDSDSALIPSTPTRSNLGHPFMITPQLRDNSPDKNFGVSSLGVLNPKSFTRHSRESLDADSDSDPDFVAWGPPTLTPSSYSVHFVPDSHQLHDNNPEEKPGLSPQSISNPDSFRHHRRLSVVDSGSGWIPRDPTSLSSHSGPSHSNKPEENLFRFHQKSSNAASSSNVIRTDDLDHNSHTKIPDNSPGGRRPLPRFLSRMLSRKSSD